MSEMKYFDWTNERVRQLIQLVEANPIIWDVYHKDYKNKMRKADAWRTIESELQCPPMAGEVKFQNLRSQFTRERRKVLASEAVGEECRSVWFGYELLSFLTKGTKLRLTSMSRPFQVKETEYTEGLIHEDSVQMLQPQVELDNCESSPSYDPRPAKMPKKRPAEGGSRERDDLELFGEYIAQELRNMDGVVRSVVKHRISNLIFKAQMGKYESYRNMFQDQYRHTYNRDEGSSGSASPVLYVPKNSETEFSEVQM